MKGLFTILTILFFAGCSREIYNPFAGRSFIMGKTTELFNAGDTISFTSSVVIINDTSFPYKLYQGRLELQLTSSDDCHARWYISQWDGTWIAVICPYTEKESIVSMKEV